MNYFRYLFLLPIAMTISVAYGNDSIPTGAWTYRDCVEWARAHNIEIRQNALSVMEDEEDVKSAKDAWLPTVNFSTSHSFTNYPSPKDGQKSNAYNSSYGVNAAWTIWEGNTRNYRLEVARLSQQQRRFTGESLAVNLELSILDAYINIMYNKEAIEIAKKTLEVSEAQKERSRRLMETGKVSKVDYAQIESQASQDAYNVVQAESSYATAVIQLKKLLELGLSYDLTIADVTFPDALVLASLPSEASVYAAAIDWLPDFKRNALSKEIYEYDIKIAKAGRLPSISLQGGLGTGYMTGSNMGWASQMGHGFNESVGLNFSVPIYDANSTKRAVAKANLAAMEYDLEQENLLNNLSQTIENLYVEARNAQAKYVSGQSQLEATELTAQLVDRQFELGSVNPLDLLTAHNNLLNARLQLLQSKYMAILSNKTIEYYANQTVNIP